MQDDLDDPDDTDMNETDGDENSDDTNPCPSCGALVYEDAEQCPKCGHYISRDDLSSKKPLWIIITACICLALILIVWVLTGR